MFEIKTVKAVKKDMKKLSHEVLQEIKKIHFRNIRENPLKSQELGYGFKGLYSYHFSLKGTSYRIIYEIFERDELIVVVMIGTRESFYDKLKRRLF
ncbi:MAG: type II toxin-antitoxin system mRNA interferase toxin, RelE/StbE family [Desulfococcaceae bacterium]|jgi:addiction module RelE/StbE family toxin|nr:type II toxin-antitoxin system mRNA interferase toxin, RelE/StbE family [Desulfococcaceae bacterium]